MELAGGIADNGYAGRHPFRDYSPHANRGAAAYDQRRAGLTLADDRARSNIGVIFNMHIAVAMHAGREGNEVADHAIMSNATVVIGVEVPADSNIAGQRDERA